MKVATKSAKPVKRLSEKTLKRKLDEIYSKYLRESAANHEGYITCYCGVRVPWQEADCSHYIPRGCLALRYDERNTTPSCRRCNRFMHGNLQAYALYLQRKWGLGVLDVLEKESRQIVKGYPYEEAIADYQLKLKELHGGR